MVERSDGVRDGAASSSMEEDGAASSSVVGSEAPHTGGGGGPEKDRNLPPLTRVLVGPPGRWLLPGFALTGLMLLYGASVPGGYFLMQMFGGLLALVLAIVWMSRFVVGLLRADGRAGLRRHWVRWAVPPVISAAVIGLLSVDAPLTARFRLSEASLERVAREVAAGRHPERDEQWIGLFHVSAIHQHEAGASFLVKGAGFLNREGFTWSPAGKPDANRDGYGDGENYYRHIHGPWYRWTEGF
ncbi:hypothetical protein FHS43_000438 [Streptosporangium becharense]|uniref:Uncharacterized protein n=1 Tax=Streptosporangium becharense TaxID=1816182 RepID=A0A7W9IGS9_9ACTN|nr:hypothetical protein [Streptosporangium becharense]MBB2909192.1 hypothetical protein [Streptosporangium becharense]MBB5819789.1 hypothetical protein [Streptosporangium becharense]